MKSIYRVILLTVLLISLSIPAFAKQEEWKSQSFDFTKIETILILNPNIDPSVNNPFAVEKTADYLVKHLNDRQIKWVGLNQIIERIKLDTGIDFSKEKDQTKLAALFREYVPKYADAVLIIDVFSFGWSTEYVEGYYKANTDTGNGTFDGRSGNTRFSGTYTTPVTSYDYVPGANEQIANAGCSFRLHDTKTSNKIWGYVEARSKNARFVKSSHPNAPINKLFKDSASPDKEMEKLIENAIKKLPIPKHK